MATNGKDDHETKCLPSGVPRMHLHPTFRKIVQLPQLIVILLERNASYRQIFLDSRPLPEDPQPSWNGYSVGRWEGDTLVVETKATSNNNMNNSRLGVREDGVVPFAMERVWFELD